MSLLRHWCFAKDTRHVYNFYSACVCVTETSFRKSYMDFHLLACHDLQERIQLFEKGGLYVGQVFWLLRGSEVTERGKVWEGACPPSTV